MFTDSEPLFSPRPFWFASAELLTKVLHAEISVVTQLLAQYPNLADLLDAPEATIQERTVCFSLLAHRSIIETVDETFTSRYEESPSIDEVESSALNRTYGLVAADAPTWVLEMLQVVEHLPHHIKASLPEALRIGGFDHDNPEQMQAIQSALKTVENVEQIQTLTGRVLDQQLRRLERRWAAARPMTNLGSKIVVQGRGPNKRKGRRTRDKQRMARDKLIADIDDVAPLPSEFVKLMDERRVSPQPTWSGWPGSWSQAYKDPRLRKLIHQDKSRALARVRRERKR
jgi:hypothetical protein